MFFQQPAEVEDSGFIRNPIQMQPGKLVQNRGFVEGLFHRQVAVAEPVFHQMNPQHGHQRIRRTTAFTLRITRLDQLNQTFPGHDLIHLNQETLTAGLLTFACVLGISERHLLHRGSTVQFVGLAYFTRFGSLFQSFLRHPNRRAAPG